MTDFGRHRVPFDMAMVPIDSYSVRSTRSVQGQHMLFVAHCG